VWAAVLGGAGLGFVWGIAARLWMRLISTNPEFSIAGTTAILVIATVFGAFVGFAFAARRRGDLARAPRGAHARPTRVDLGRRASLPLAAVALPEAGIGDHRHVDVTADDLRGARRPPEVRCIDRPGPKAIVREATGPSRGLGLARRRERRVEPSLPAPVDVPRRFAVAEDQHLLHRNHSEAETV